MSRDDCTLRTLQLQAEATEKAQSSRRSLFFTCLHIAAILVRLTARCEGRNRISCVRMQPLLCIGWYINKFDAVAVDRHMGWFVAGAVGWMQLTAATTTMLGMHLKPLQVRQSVARRRLLPAYVLVYVLR